MSPFEVEIDRLANRIRMLSTRARIALFAGAADVLTARYADWSSAAGLPPEDELLQQSLDHATSLAAGAVAVPDRELIDRVEASTPAEPTAAPWFTAAQDCWICIDTAVRAGLAEFDAADSTWYLLEPMLQATSERLFGYSDVGSQDQELLETRALADDRLASAIAAVDRAVDGLEATEPTQETVADIARVLEPIRP